MGLKNNHAVKELIIFVGWQSYTNDYFTFIRNLLENIQSFVFLCGSQFRSQGWFIACKRKFREKHNVGMLGYGHVEKYDMLLYVSCDISFVGTGLCNANFHGSVFLCKCIKDY